MIRRYLLATLALLGIAAACAAVLIDNRTQPVEEPVVTPASPPYPSYVAGAGLIEARTGNIAIGSPVAGVATELYVHAGDFVDAGAPLFKIDDRDLEAQLITARAKVAAAQAALEQPRHQLRYFEQLATHDKTAVSVETLTELRDQVAIAASNLALANAEVSQLELELERYTVRAPVSGRVLQLDLRAGEYVDGTSMPLVLFGDDRTMFVRVDVDESNAWRVKASAKAEAFVRGNPTIRIPLTFEYIEPHIIPKTSLTGRSTERTDTRVLQVLYGFPHGALPVHVGEQLDVFIEAPPVARASAQTGG